MEFPELQARYPNIVTGCSNITLKWYFLIVVCIQQVDWHLSVKKEKKKEIYARDTSI